jgi:hypothetical protein
MKHLARFLAHDMIRGRSPNTKHPGWKCLTFLIFPIDACEILRLEGFTISCVILLKYPCALRNERLLEDGRRSGAPKKTQAQISRAFERDVV